MNVYNLRFDGEWNDIKTFIFPIGSEGYNMQEILRVPLPKPLTEYMVQMIVFVASAFSSFIKVKKIQREIKMKRISGCSYRLAEWDCLLIL